jgi:hypothetical protein
MKVGTLVRLSTYGKYRKRADWIERDDIGIIIKIKKYDHNYPDNYIVKWCKSDFKTKRNAAGYGQKWRWEEDNHRKDLVYAK